MRQWQGASIVETTIMPKYWCVNFEHPDCLKHGIDCEVWVMGYQYDERASQGNRKTRITLNWRQLKEISPSDRFVAYLPTNTFFATGTVRTPRRPKARHDRVDTIDKYLERRESYHQGYVYFTPVVYENFTDDLDGYPVRIDVDEWENYVPDGIVLPIVNKIALNERQKAVFEITKADFDRIVKKLASVNESSSAAPDGPAATELSKAGLQVDETGYFSPGSLKDEREKKLREIVERRGQPDFRNKLITAYNGRCAVTGCDAVAALEAAHIVPYTGPHSNHVTNGLLLRADIHTLFDLDLIGINPGSLSISLSPAIRTSVYAELHGQRLLGPVKATNTPKRDALLERWKRFRKAKGAPGSSSRRE